MEQIKQSKKEKKMEETIMVNLLLASGAAIIGAAAGAFGRDLIINKTVVVDATDLSDPKVVLQPKREKKKKEVKQVEKVEEKVDEAEKEFPQEDVAEAEVVIEKVEGEVVESNEKVEPATEPETVLEPEPEKPVDQAEEKPKNKRSKKAKAGEENQNTTASPEEPAIVTNTAETQPAQFTTIDKPVDKQEESQSTTEANNQ